MMIEKIIQRIMNDARNNQRLLVSLSGGMDSTTLLGDLISRGKNIGMCVSFRYGSKHNPYEMDAVKKVMAWYNTKLMRNGQPAIVHREVDLTDVMKTFKSNLLRGQDEVPDGHYEEENMRQTVVPCRNLIFLSILAGIAESEGLSCIFMATHQGDHHIYPDCRPEFLEHVNKSIHHATDQKVDIHTPYEYKSKAEILLRGKALKVPYHLTRTCYKEQEVACGKCGSCQERLEAFFLNGLTDPIEYESRELLPKSM